MFISMIADTNVSLITVLVVLAIIVCIVWLVIHIRGR